MSRIVLRGIPDDLLREIRQAAALNCRGVSAEIVGRLDESFGRRNVDAAQLLERFRRRQKSIGAMDTSEGVLCAMKNAGRR